MDIRVQMGKSYQDGLSLKKHKLFFNLESKMEVGLPSESQQWLLPVMLEAQ